jgi:NADH-quinone oxidoreductase subunit E
MVKSMAELNDDSHDIREFINNLIVTKALDKTKIILLLQGIQHEFGYLSREAITELSGQLNVPVVDIFGVATFYEQFRFTKPGKHLIKVCEGTACHVKGGAAITQTLERELGIGPGETTDDELFSLERVACLGCCALAPVIVIDEEIHGMMSTSNLTSLLENYTGGSDSKPDSNTDDETELEGGE